ncbi:hypothetical protein V6N13_136832 [Hibiscus sabdariffa]|uniref:Uncharacterized protein n=1 Tax=Hibiscus sabdariffa TaxID=183260 RepID=A0ABR2DMG0_9ROSI
MISTLQQLPVEPENAQREAEEMNKKIEKLKLEAEASSRDTALDEIKMHYERTNAARASTPESGADDITISREEIESLNHMVEESNNIAEMKVATAMAQVEAVKARENEALKRFEVIQKEIQDMKVATADALKRADMAEAAKKVVEGELQRWREREQKKKQRRPAKPSP